MDDLRRLWDAYHRLRDSETRSRLVEHYMPLARIIAAKLYGLRFDATSSFDDYLQYARVGLIEAVDRYDVSRNTSFETFSSYRIRGAILNGITHNSEAAAQMAFWRERGQERLASLRDNLRTVPDDAELTDLVDLTVELALGLILDDAAIGAVDESPSTNPYAAAEFAQLTQRIRELVSKLPDREREIIESHYYEHHEFQWLADKLGLSKGRVSQLHARALGRLRELLREGPKVDRKL